MASLFNNYFFIILAILAGMVLPLQATVNNKLADSVGNPVLAALISFTVGTLALFIYCLLTGVSLGNLTTAKSAPLVAWLGGLFGAFFVAVTALIIPRIGVALTFSLAIAGQTVVTLIIDHFGLLGVSEKPLNLMRVLGAALITTGVVLVRKF